MECKEVLSKVDKYYEKRLSDIEKHSIEKHLDKCNTCKIEYENLGFAFSILDSHFICSPDDLADKVMIKISNLESSKKRSTKLLKNLGASFVAAGILISLLNFSNYDYKIIARGFYRGAFEINQVVTNPKTIISEGLKYVKNFYSFNK
ncbi:MAG: zf-HC2 domain-containing protein [Tissierellales bacterium]